MKSEFLRFIVVGAIAAIANIGSRIVFSQWMAFVPAMAVAFVIGLTTAFLLNRSWVFIGSGKRWFHEAAWFLGINLLGLAQTLAIAWVLARHLLPSLGQRLLVMETAHSIGVIIPILTSYLGHKYFTFKRRP
ncbi:MAG: GtrA family protein [Luteimonas sp.]